MEHCLRCISFVQRLFKKGNIGIYIYSNIHSFQRFVASCGVMHAGVVDVPPLQHTHVVGHRFDLGGRRRFRVWYKYLRMDLFPCIVTVIVALYVG